MMKSRNQFSFSHLYFREVSEFGRSSCSCTAISADRESSAELAPGSWGQKLSHSCNTGLSSVCYDCTVRTICVNFTISIYFFFFLNKSPQKIASF